MSPLKGSLITLHDSRVSCGKARLKRMDWTVPKINFDSWHCACWYRERAVRPAVMRRASTVFKLHSELIRVGRPVYMCGQMPQALLLSVLSSLANYDTAFIKITKLISNNSLSLISELSKHITQSRDLFRPPISDSWPTGLVLVRVFRSSVGSRALSFSDPCCQIVSHSVDVETTVWRRQFS